MKITATLLFCAFFGSIYAQIKGSLPALENVSRQDIEIIDGLTPGRKIVFTQNCNPNLPPTVSNGIVQFEGLHTGKSDVVASIEFKDTVIQKLIFEFATSDAEAFRYFKVPIDGFTELSKKTYYQTYLADGYQYDCYIYRRKVVLVKTAPKIVN